MRLAVNNLSGLRSVKGLIGKDSPCPVSFRTRFGIHTFGVKFPIDILILDKNYRVIKIKKSLQPNKLFFWNPKYNVVVELPEGVIGQKNINLGDTVHLTRMILVKP